MRTVREVGGTSWPTLTRTNYDEWAVTMKVKLRARWLWNAIDKVTDNEEMTCQCWRLSSLLCQRSTESHWGRRALLRRRGRPFAAIRVGFDRAKKATA